MSQFSTDFRKKSKFILENVIGNGDYLGRTTYGKLYTVENLYRIIIHSVLLVQVDPDWWSVATPPAIQRKAQDSKDNYLEKPWYTIPGQHFIYFINLNDLNEIARRNSGSFEPIIPTIDNWVQKIEDMRLPRNVVAHMNFPNRRDRKRIDIIYEDFKALISNIQNEGKLILEIPK